MRAKAERRRTTGRGRGKAARKGRQARGARRGRRRSRPKADEERVMEAARLFAAMNPGPTDPKCGDPVAA